ncbi:hypothetical protein [Acinetobacter nectaris]|uniref:hypothetical protein n=1 Tax=Acinetobacter nectaris TaxID=1219382 RepID=UPI001F3E6F9F|nr:hypothetical protein [Acinetobacter nectaris]MCF8999845.1 hypothetical protein [Acinetobacter nectaris]MCF9026758.1 hypothetical protein [Acinetobacter nectaris]
MIEKKEIFERLKCYYKENEHYKKDQYDLICMLENIEFVLEAIKENTYPNQEKYQKAKQEKDIDLVERFLSFYKKICIDFDLVDMAKRKYDFKGRVGLYLKHMRNHDDIELDSREVNWTIESFPEKSFFNLLKCFTQRLTENISDQSKPEAKKATDFKNACEIFDTQLEINEQLFFCDFYINFNFFNEKVLHVENSLSRLAKFLVEEYGLVLEFSRKEVDLYNHLLVQKIYVFRKTGNMKNADRLKLIKNVIEDNLSKYLDRKWFDVTDNLERINASILGGTNPIKVSLSKGEKNKFKELVLGYIYHVNTVLKPFFGAYNMRSNSIAEYQAYVNLIDFSKISQKQDFSDKYVVKDPKIIKNDKSSALDQLKKLIDLKLPDKTTSHIKNLPEIVKDELKMMEIFYLNYVDSKYIKILMSIEYFMRLIQYNKIKRFKVTHTQEDLNNIKKKPAQFLSQEVIIYLKISKELLILDDSFLNELINETFCSHRVKKFLYLHNRNDLTRHLNIDDRGIITLNKKLASLQSDNLDEKNRIFIPKYQESVKVAKNIQQIKIYLDKCLSSHFFAFNLKFYFSSNSDENFCLNIEFFKDYLKNLKRTKKNSGANLIAYVGGYFLDNHTYKNELTAEVTLIFQSKFAMNSNSSEKAEHKNEVAKNINSVINTTRSNWKNYIEIKAKNTSCKVSNISYFIPTTIWVTRKKVINLSKLRFKIILILKRTAENKTINNKILLSEEFDNLIFESQVLNRYESNSEEIHFTEIKDYQPDEIKKFKNYISDLYAAQQLLYPWTEVVSHTNIFGKTKIIKQLIKGNLS